VGTSQNAHAATISGVRVNAVSSEANAISALALYNHSFLHVRVFVLAICRFIPCYAVVQMFLHNNYVPDIHIRILFSYSVSPVLSSRSPFLSALTLLPTMGVHLAERKS